MSKTLNLIVLVFVINSILQLLFSQQNVTASISTSSKTASLSKGIIPITINSIKLQAGIYIYRFMQDGKSITGKIKKVQ